MIFTNHNRRLLDSENQQYEIWTNGGNDFLEKATRLLKVALFLLLILVLLTKHEPKKRLG